MQTVAWCVCVCVCVCLYLTSILEDGRCVASFLRSLNLKCQNLKIYKISHTSNCHQTALLMLVDKAVNLLQASQSGLCIVKPRTVCLLRLMYSSMVCKPASLSTSSVGGQNQEPSSKGRMWRPVRCLPTLE